MKAERKNLLNFKMTRPTIKHGRVPKCRWRDKSVVTLNNSQQVLKIKQIFNFHCLLVFLIRFLSGNFLSPMRDYSFVNVFHVIVHFEDYFPRFFCTPCCVHWYLFVTAADRWNSDWIKIKFQYQNRDKKYFVPEHISIYPWVKWSDF